MSWSLDIDLMGFGHFGGGYLITTSKVFEIDLLCVYGFRIFHFGDVLREEG